MDQALNHFDKSGRAVMVDVTQKQPTSRTAVARGAIHASRPPLPAPTKGDVLGVARVAGIMAAKRTSELIPLCHPLALTHASVSFRILEDACAVEATCTVKLTGRTGVEMEALTGVSAALLTIYDMCKALDRGMVLSGIRLVHKEGGKSGVYDCPRPSGGHG